MSIMRLAEAGYRLLVLVGDLCGHLLLLVFRLNWGWQLFVNGKGKLANHGDIVDFFKSLNLPYPDFTAWFVGGVECLGGLALVAGFGSRAVGLVLTINMTVAYLSVPDDRQKVLDIFKSQDAFLQADPFFYLLTAIVVFVFGSGFFSVDQILKSFVFERKQSSELSEDKSAEAKV